MAGQRDNASGQTDEPMNRDELEARVVRAMERYEESQKRPRRRKVWSKKANEPGSGKGILRIRPEIKRLKYAP